MVIWVTFQACPLSISLISELISYTLIISPTPKKKKKRTWCERKNKPCCWYTSSFYLPPTILILQFSCNSHGKIKTRISVSQAHLGVKVRLSKINSRHKTLREGILTTTTSKWDRNQPLCDNSDVPSLLNKQRENPRAACSKLPGPLERVGREGLSVIDAKAKPKPSYRIS